MIQPLLHQEFESGFLPVEDSVTAMLCSLPHGPHPPPPPSRAHPARWVRQRAGVAGDAAGGVFSSQAQLLKIYGQDKPKDIGHQLRRQHA